MFLNQNWNYNHISVLEVGGVIVDVGFSKD